MSLISIITPFYNEEEGISHYFGTIIPLLEQLKDQYEIICIDDGSHDDTFSLLTEKHQQNPRIKVIKFSRNFGKEVALTAGLDFSTGDAVIPIDADLQDPPELILTMVEKWKEGYKVVLMQRNSRQESWLKRITANNFYSIINKLTKESIQKDVGDFRLLDKQVVKTVCSLKEKNRFMKGILSWGGYKSITLSYDRPDRVIGEAKQNYKKLFQLAFDGIFSFSSLPLRIWSFLGVLVALSAFIYGIAVAISKLLFGNEVNGYTSLMVAILFFNGLIMLSIGIMGEYVSRIFDEVKNRPLYVVEERLSSHTEKKDNGSL